MVVIEISDDEAREKDDAEMRFFSVCSSEVEWMSKDRSVYMMKWNRGVRK